MRCLNANDCAVLRLVLTGKWYFLIDSGVKREEYRALSDYWTRRITNWQQNLGVHVVAFSFGYRKADMFFLCGDCYTTWVRRHANWGEPFESHYVICLGERVELEGL